MPSISSNAVRSSHIAAAQIAFMSRSMTEPENEFSAASIPIISAPPGIRRAPPRRLPGQANVAGRGGRARG